MHALSNVLVNVLVRIVLVKDVDVVLVVYYVLRATHWEVSLFILMQTEPADILPHLFFPEPSRLSKLALHIVIEVVKVIYMLDALVVFVEGWDHLQLPIFVLHIESAPMTLCIVK